MNTRTNRILCGAVMMAGALLAQDDPRGHWTGAIDIPDHALAVEIDLDKTAKGWVGSIAIPTQNASGLPLKAITFTNGKCTFQIQGAPGEPTFTGTLSADGKTLLGDFTQGGGIFPFKLSRAGDAKVEEIKRSPEVAKEFLGTWEGTLEAGQVGLPRQDCRPRGAVAPDALAAFAKAPCLWATSENDPWITVWSPAKTPGRHIAKPGWPYHAASGR
jgi:hypothetical protein